jgi:hypothetical protein
MTGPKTGGRSHELNCRKARTVLMERSMISRRLGNQCYGLSLAKRCCLYTLSLVLLGQPADAAHAPRTYRRVVNLGLCALQEKNSCLNISASLTAGDFFKGLKSVNTPAGVVFHKRNSVVTYFPSQLQIRIQITSFPCHAIPGTLPLPAPKLDWIKGVNFQIAWKTKSIAHAPQTVQARLLGDAVRNRISGDYVYLLGVPSDGHLLAEVLFVSVLDDDKQLVQFSIRLGQEPKILTQREAITKESP